MTISTSHIKIMKSVVVNATTTNGGRMSTNEWLTARTNEEYPQVNNAEMLTGSTLYLKSFVKVAHPQNEIAENVRIGLWKPTAGQDKVFLIPATQTDTQASFGTTLFGCGSLYSSVSAGQSAINVLVESGSDVVFRNGDEIRISDIDFDTNLGSEEFNIVNGTPIINGDIVTIYLVKPLLNDYSSTNTYVTSLINAGNIGPSNSTPVVTSVAGTFDQQYLEVQSIGSLYETVTLTFVSGVSFTCVGDTLGSLGSGNIVSAFSPINPAFGTPYFIINPSAWGGAFVAGNTVEFIMIPAAYPYVEKRVIIPGANSIEPYTRTLLIIWDSNV